MKHSALGFIADKFGIIMISAVLLASANASAQGQPLVRISTSIGDMIVELQSKVAPNTVAHFLRNVDDKVYDGTIFHKMVPDFVLQGGGFDQNFKERPAAAILQHEGQKAAARGNIRNTKGTLGMARNLTRDSASLEFFINLADNPDLDPVAVPDADPVPRFEWGGKVYTNVPRDRLLDAPELFGYTPFGKIVSGVELVEKFRSLKTTGAGPFSADVPVVPVVIRVIERIPGVTVAAAPVLPLPTVVALPDVSAAPLAVITKPTPSVSQVEDALRRWSTAWASKDLTNYFVSYATEFVGQGAKNRSDWEAQRTARITEKSKISLQLRDVDIKVTGDIAVVRFKQAYRADAVKINSNKTLTFNRRAGAWLIVKEESK